VASLIVTTEHLRGIRVPLGAARTTVGRQADCDGVLDDPTVSRRHAVIEQDGAGLLLRDLGSRNGTTVNGRPVSGTVSLHAGDLVSFGSVDLRVEAAADPRAADPRAADRRGADRRGADRRGADFNVGNQAADQIHNVGGDQYIQHIRAERESFLADIAATKTKGRWLVRFGFLCTIAGFALFGYGVVSFIQIGTKIDISAPEPEFPSPFGPDVYGVPLGVIGIALFTIGLFSLIVGIVLHVGAAARLRRLQNATWPPR
jgi:pSer/pThr/pTyr-binding forkhead associated (FHA) protein